jgi:hypothetical protein
MLVIKNKVSGHQQEVSDEDWKYMSRVKLGRSTMDKLFIIVSNTPHVPVKVQVPAAVLDFKNKNSKPESPAAAKEKNADENK